MAKIYFNIRTGWNICAGPRPLHTQNFILNFACMTLAVFHTTPLFSLKYRTGTATPPRWNIIIASIYAVKASIIHPFNKILWLHINFWYMIVVFAVYNFHKKIGLKFSYFSYPYTDKDITTIFFETKSVSQLKIPLRLECSF